MISTELLAEIDAMMPSPEEIWPFINTRKTGSEPAWVFLTPPSPVTGTQLLVCEQALQPGDCHPLDKGLRVLQTRHLWQDREEQRFEVTFYDSDRDTYTQQVSVPIARA